MFELALFMTYDKVHFDVLHIYLFIQFAVEMINNPTIGSDCQCRDYQTNLCY